MIWRCPKCASPLFAEQAGARCREGHQYDLSRQGYFNLLLANQKNSRQPGDSEEMMAARHAFLRQGFYRPLQEVVCTLLAEHLQPGKAYTLLDLGCGEGYYTEALTASMGPRSVGYGVDISKAAIRKAGTHARALQRAGSSLALSYAVASTYALPVCSATVDVAVNIFAPFNMGELQRVLQSQALFLKVSPAARHLYEVKSFLYDEVRLHEQPAIEPCFTLLAMRDLTFTLSLRSSAEIENLLAMTPFHWHGAKQSLLANESLEVTAHFHLQLMRYQGVADD